MSTSEKKYTTFLVIDHCGHGGRIERVIEPMTLANYAPRWPKCDAIVGLEPDPDKPGLMKQAERFNNPNRMAPISYSENHAKSIKHADSRLD